MQSQWKRETYYACTKTIRKFEAKKAEKEQSSSEHVKPGPQPPPHPQPANHDDLLHNAEEIESNSSKMSGKRPWREKKHSSERYYNEQAAKVAKMTETLHSATKGFYRVLETEHGAYAKRKSSNIEIEDENPWTTKEGHHFFDADRWMVIRSTYAPWLFNNWKKEFFNRKIIRKLQSFY